LDVFVIPFGRDRYELYSEHMGDEDVPLDPPSRGIVGRLRHSFTVMLRRAEERRRTGALPEAEGFVGRLQERVMAYVAERIAEQRLLWTLRTETAAVAMHPTDLTFEQALTLIRRMLQRDYERHRRWLAIDAVLGLASVALILVPGPNVIGYYFAFRIVGHYLSLRGAMQGLDAVRWTGLACEPLTELRGVAGLPAADRAGRVRDVAQRLHLEHLPKFYERVSIAV
jgi:hypothetical protein